MGTQDISRSAFDPRKRYTGVRMQMGRVIVDDDWNENERIGDEDLRHSRVDIIGPAGTPDAGFRVENAGQNLDGNIDFDLQAGTFYLGGYRLELIARQTYLLQLDQLQGDLKTTPAADRVDMVYLTTYLQPVSAVEDSELFEVALGGPDTSTRMRIMQRVRLVEDVGQLPCDQAWQVVLAKLAEEGLGSLNDENELVPDTSLQVSFAAAGSPDDLCSPTAAGGYLGAENQAIRIQIVDPGHFTWGFNNAAPLYRVQLSGDRKTVTMLTEPKDQAHWPLTNQVVEILPWGAVLPNNEKIAEIGGHLTKVQASYHPDTGQLTLVDAVPTSGFDDWKARDDAAELAVGGEYYYLRVWNRGGDTGSPEAISIAAGPIDLGMTGLKITFSSSQFAAGDYWVIAARPETPNRVVPWVLESGRGPHGIRRFVAPLALIHWPADLANPPQVDDCRPHFRPLTRQKRCCTYMVGDGVQTHGDFDSLEEALQHLPQSGGTLCLLPGVHEANLLIQNRMNITVEGCGKSTKVIPGSQHRQEPIFQVFDSQEIALLNMDMVAIEGRAVEAGGSQPGSLKGLKIVGNRILAFLNAIHVAQGQDVLIESNVIRMLDKDGGDVAIFLLADDARIERNNLGVVPPEIVPPTDRPGDGGQPTRPTDPCAKPGEFYLNRLYLVLYTNFVLAFTLIAYFLKDPYKTLGGIQIGSGSERVKILENTITGGAGNGITLGSDLDIADVPPQEPPPQEQPVTFQFAGGDLWGHASDGINNRSNLPLKFSRDGQSEEFITGSDPNAGYFSGQLKGGVFTVTSGDPGYRVTKIEARDTGEFGTYAAVTFDKVDVQVDLLDALAFIYDLTIQGNDIANMGESGIGIPRANLADLVQAYLEGRLKGIDVQTLIMLLILIWLFGAPVGYIINLHIQANHIHDCLGNLFNLQTEDLGERNRGVGGISLGLCDGLMLRENRIERNGRQYLGPAQAIHIIYGANLDISNNHIFENGPAQINRLQQGKTGGITVFFTSSGDLLLPDADDRTNQGFNGKQALRVHDNLVHQPVGRALAVMAMGPVSIADNQLVTEFAVPRSSVQTGSVVATTDFSSTKKVSLSAANPSWLSLVTDAGTALVLNLGVTEAFQSAGRKTPGLPSLPTGSTLFNDNQVRLAVAGQILLSMAILALDDVSFDANQLEVLSEVGLAANSLLFGVTTRANGNRLQEPLEQKDTKISMLSFGIVFNTTTLNQGNHCIIAKGLQVLDAGNFPALDICTSLSGKTHSAALSGTYGYRIKR
jgi:hypothetical protein